MRFGEILPSGLEVILKKSLMDAKQTEGHTMITIAHLKPMAQVS